MSLIINQEELLAKMKRDVRSLLVSSKCGLDPEQLRKDYVTMLGHPMPLKRMGFRNVLDMAKEMPDVVSITFRQDNSICLKAVSHESTQDIEALIAKQRKSKTEKKCQKRGFNFSHPHYRHQSATMVLPRRGPAPPAVPVQLRSHLRILLSQGPIKVSDVESCYLRCFGLPLRPHSYGFYSTGEMLMAAADLVLIQQSRLGSVVSLRNHMIPRSLFKPPSSAPVKVASQSAGKETFRSPVTKAQSPVKSAMKPPLSQPSSETTIDGPQSLSTAVDTRPEMVDKNQDAGSEPCQGQTFQKHVLKLEEKLRQQILENGVAGAIDQELKDRLRKVVCQTGGGMFLHNLPAEYKRVFGEDLPLLQSGFVSVTELVGAMGDTFYLKPAKSDWLVVAIPDSNITQSESEDSESLDHKVALPFSSGYVSPAQCHWDSKLEGDDEDELTTEDQDEELQTSDNSRTQEVVSVICPAIQVHCSSAVPLDALLSQRLKKPTRHGTREVVPVLVEHIETPGRFYIRFSQSEEAQALEELMFEMRRYYTWPEAAERYQLPQQFVRRGQVCCVSPPGMWFYYRVVIHRVITPAQVEVYYVDYGVTTDVQSSSLKFLKSCYSALPAQAVPALLAGIEPATGTWTAAATATFRDLCPTVPLVGALNCYIGDVLQLYLCDTRTDFDVYIHSVLVSQGQGTACSPAASAERCGCEVSPVSLYLGEGMVDLPEVEVETLEVATLTSLKVDEEEMPPLEPIEEHDLVQSEDSNLFTAPLSDQTLGCSELDFAMNEELLPTSLSGPTPSHLTPPDVIQTNPSPTTFSLTPPAVPSTACYVAPEEEQHQLKVATPSAEPLNVLKLLSLHTPDLSPAVPLHKRNSGLQFPVFGSSRWTLQHPSCPSSPNMFPQELR
ncbi:uncharacterized protein V6R79_011119 [Siganus canaliculatus]